MVFESARNSVASDVQFGGERVRSKAPIKPYMKSCVRAGKIGVNAEFMSSEKALQKEIERQSRSQWRAGKPQSKQVSVQFEYYTAPKIKQEIQVLNRKYVVTHNDVAPIEVLQPPKKIVLKGGMSLKSFEALKNAKLEVTK